MFRPIMPIISYAVNYEYISTELCENKDTPEMECNGKCHLKKELAKEIQENNPVSESKKVNFAESTLLFCSEIVPFTFEKVHFNEEVENMTSYSNLYQKENFHSIFHPPTILS
ncbi:MAG: hypothetical protein PHQ74_02895 [Crocinitomicaceae bacterium]|nr:hypothetical protein [Crocinitomicaceae bacterium]